MKAQTPKRSCFSQHGITLAAIYVKMIIMNDEDNNLRPTRPDHATNETEVNSNTYEGTELNAVYLGSRSPQSGADHPREDSGITSAGVDDLQSNSDGAASSGGAGTAERKTYGDIELNKGLEAQAKDEES